jgi:hypothetical protein
MLRHDPPTDARVLGIRTRCFQKDVGRPFGWPNRALDGAHDSRPKLAAGESRGDPRIRLTLLRIDRQGVHTRDGERKGRDQAVTSLTRPQPVHIMAPLIGPFRYLKTPERPWVSITHERRGNGSS